MENLQQILDCFLESLQSLPDMIGRLLKTIGEHEALLGVLIAFLALLVGIAGLWLQRRRARKPPDPIQPGADRDRTAMLAKIRANWVKPWLEGDLYQHARVELQLTAREDAVQTRIHRYNQTGGDPGPEIPRDKPIEEIFDEAAGQLLILGEPGTGKSTKLVELAGALLDRAAKGLMSSKGENVSGSSAVPSQPIPVILNLSSWTRQQAALGEWIQSELVRLYGVSRPRARQWVEGADIVPLLDGRDEVAAEQRAACVEAINIFRRERGLQPIAVCCRLEEYRRLPAPLDLAVAVAVEPLRRDEVESYLDKHGFKVQRVRKALRDDPGLWDLMNTPLMLTVLFLASGVEGDGARSEPDPRRRLYLRFVRKMFSGPRTRRFGEEKALRWLGWLAAQLVNRSQIPFALEDLDLDWLPSRRARRAASVIFGLVGGLIAGLVWGLVVGLAGGLVGGLLWGLVGGLVGGLVAGLVGAVVAWLVGTLVGGLVGGLLFRLVGGLLFGLFVGLVVRLGGSKRPFDPVDALSVDWRRLPQALGFGLVGGLVAGLFAWLGFGLVGGLLFGLVGGLFFGLDQILRPAAVSERSAANEGTSRSLRYALRISSAGVALAIAMAWLLSELRGAPEGTMSDVIESATAAAPAGVVWFSVLLTLQKGGFFFLLHWAVRAQLQRLDLAPRHYVQFLDEAADMLFLRKPGGAYQFFHVTFRDFVAETYGTEWLTKTPKTPESKQTVAAN